MKTNIAMSNVSICFLSKYVENHQGEDVRNLILGYPSVTNNFFLNFFG